MDLPSRVLIRCVKVRKSYSEESVMSATTSQIHLANRERKHQKVASMRPNICMVVTLCSLFIWQVYGGLTATHGDITNWQTGQTIPGTEGITPGPNMQLSGYSTDAHNLRFADFSGGLDLQGSSLSRDWASIPPHLKASRRSNCTRRPATRTTICPGLV